MISKKHIILAGASVALLSGAFLVFAQEAGTANTATPTVAPTHAMPMVVQIGPEGRALLRGTIKTLAATSLTVTSWGGDWVVNTTASTKLMPGSDMTQFEVGDFVGVQGKASTTGTWVIDADLVRNWTARKQVVENKKEIKELMRSMAPKNWEGVASNVNTTSSTLTLTIDGTAYSVVLAANAKVVNKMFIVVPFSSIQNGDTVRVYGPLTDTTITASVVRDTSL